MLHPHRSGRFVRLARTQVFQASCHLLALMCLTSSPAFASDWPQWRGADGSGVTTEAGLPVRWSADEGIRWKIDLPGRGLSSPIIAGGRLYLTACTGPTQDQKSTRLNSSHIQKSRMPSSA